MSYHDDLEIFFSSTVELENITVRLVTTYTDEGVCKILKEQRELESDRLEARKRIEDYLKQKKAM